MVVNQRFEQQIREQKLLLKHCGQELRASHAECDWLWETAVLQEEAGGDRAAAIVLNLVDAVRYGLLNAGAAGSAVPFQANGNRP